MGGVFEHVFEAELQEVSKRRGADLAGGLELPEFHVDRPSALLEDLLAELSDKRQTALWRQSSESIGCQPGLTGIALSGGGIRSSTFNLGVLQALHRVGLFKAFDYLSTVSGGSYIGTYLCTSILEESADEPPPDREIFPLGHTTGSQENARFRHLRNYASFMFPGGRRDAVATPLAILRGIVVNVICLLPMFVAAAIMLALIIVRVVPGGPFSTLWGLATFPFSASAALVGVLLSLLALYPLVHRFVRRPPQDQPALVGRLASRLPRDAGMELMGWLAILAGATFVLELQPYLLGLVDTLGQPGTLSIGWPGGAFAALVLGTLLLAGFADRVAHGPDTPAWRVGLGALAVVGLVVAWAGFLMVVLALIDGTLSLVTTIGTGAVALVYSLLFVDVNVASVHRFYRDKLVAAFVAQAVDDGPQARSRVPKLTELDTTRAPYQLINAAVDVKPEEAALRNGRRVGLFFFSKRYCGGVRTSFCETQHMEDADPQLDVGTAMAISGALLAPTRPQGFNRLLTFVLSIFNARLSYWVANPRVVSEAYSSPEGGHLVSRGRLRLERVGPAYLIREAMGWVSGRSPYVNVSDGGYVENLGLYELIRRQCRFIVVGDGEFDPDLSFRGLSEVVRMARIDFGFQVEMDGLDEIRRGLQQYAVGRIRYDDDRMGILLYLKANLGGDYNLEATLDADRYRTSPERDDDGLYDNNPYVAHYKEKHAGFPHESAADVVFDERQFESYRALGYDVAVSALLRPWTPEQEEEE